MIVYQLLMFMLVRKYLSLIFNYSNVIKGHLKGKTILFITHAIHLTKECDNILVLKDGEIEE